MECHDTSCTTRFSIQQSHILITKCTYVFCVDLRTNNVYFPIQYYLIDFYNLYCGCLLRPTDLMLLCCKLLMLKFATRFRTGCIQ